MKMYTLLMRLSIPPSVQELWRLYCLYLIKKKKKERVINLFIFSTLRLPCCLDVTCAVISTLHLCSLASSSIPPHSITKTMIYKKTTRTTVRRNNGINDCYAGGPEGEAGGGGGEGGEERLLSILNLSLKL